MNTPPILTELQTRLRDLIPETDRPNGQWAVFTAWADSGNRVTDEFLEQARQSESPVMKLLQTENDKEMRLKATLGIPIIQHLLTLPQQFVDDFNQAVRGVIAGKNAKRESPSEFSTLGIEAGGFLFGNAQKNYGRADEWLRILTGG